MSVDCQLWHTFKDWGIKLCIPQSMAYLSRTEEQSLVYHNQWRDVLCLKCERGVEPVRRQNDSKDRTACKFCRSSRTSINILFNERQTGLADDCVGKVVFGDTICHPRFVTPDTICHPRFVTKETKMYQIRVMFCQQDLISRHDWLANNRLVTAG